jgi:hypothetical protein
MWNSITKPNCYLYRHRHCNGYCHRHPNGDSHRDCNSNCNRDRDSHRHGYTDRNSNSHGHASSYSYTKAHSNPTTSSYAKAPSDSAASSVTGSTARLPTKVERVVLRKGAWLPRSFMLNALPRVRHRLRDKAIHLHHFPKSAV